MQYKKSKRRLSVVVFSLVMMATCVTTLAGVSVSKLTFSYKNTKAIGMLEVNWKIGKDIGFSSTGISNGDVSGAQACYAAVFAYSSTAALGAESNKAQLRVVTPTLSATANQYKSKHILMTSSYKGLTDASTNDIWN